MTSTDADAELLDFSSLTLSNPKVLLLFHVPQSLLVGLLSEWLDLRSLGRLDTAVSSKIYRPLFLNSLHIMRSETVENIERCEWSTCSTLGEWSGLWWRWLSIRRIYVESVSLSDRNQINTIWSTAIDNDELLVLPSLRKVQFSSCSDDDLAYLVRASPDIQSLNFETSIMRFLPQEGLLSKILSNRRNDPYVSDIGLQIIAQAYQHSLLFLSYERMVWCGYGPASELSEDCVDYFVRSGNALVSLCHQCSRLQEIKLSGDALRTIDLNELCPFGHLFRELKFEGKDDAYLRPSDQVISNLLQKCANLTKLTYSGSNPNESADPRLVLTTLHQSCPLLEELDLSSIHADTLETTLPRLCQNLVYVRKLVLSGCELTDANLHSISGMQLLNDLELLNCEGLTNVGVSSLAKLPLVKLVIEEIDYQDGEVHVEPSVLTEAALLSFADHGAIISQTLETFRLHVMLNYEQHHLDPVHIADDQVAMAFAACHKLKILRIFWGSKCEFGVANGIVGLKALVCNAPILYINTKHPGCQE